LFSLSAINPKVHYDTPDPSFKDLRPSGVPGLESTTLAFTPAMQKRLNRRVQAMVERSLFYFPELRGKTITVGYTRKHLGSATVISRSGVATRLVIRLRVRRVTYQTIGHELTHLVQALAHGDRSTAAFAGHPELPSGEKQCDIWTLARHDIFCDDAPTYLRLPRFVRESWPGYAQSVRALCMAAVEKRKTHRHYIRWLEAELANLAEMPLRQRRATQQLELPFAE
jgi:hypothetical protein